MTFEHICDIWWPKKPQSKTRRFYHQLHHASVEGPTCARWGPSDLVGQFSTSIWARKLKGMVARVTICRHEVRQGLCGSTRVARCCRTIGPVKTFLFWFCRKRHMKLYCSLMMIEYRLITPFSCKHICSCKDWLVLWYSFAMLNIVLPCRFYPEAIARGVSLAPFLPDAKRNGICPGSNGSWSSAPAGVSHSNSWVSETLSSQFEKAMNMFFCHDYYTPIQVAQVHSCHILHRDLKTSNM